MPAHDFHRLRAAWVFPVDQPPMRDGVVEILDGKITAVRSYRAQEDVRDLGNVACVPGLRNAHTHLEFSDISAPLGERGMNFPDWIRRVIARRGERATADTAGDAKSVAIRAGIMESQQAGVAVI